MAGNLPRRPGWGPSRASIELANYGDGGSAEGRQWLSGQASQSSATSSAPALPRARRALPLEELRVAL
ncbi:MAG TPA: hypothetical protein VMV93_14920, partial [Chloroflexota bacterium]|nr:hypothetical protein [Chloroflexota bacterium]